MAIEKCREWEAGKSLDSASISHAGIQEINPSQLYLDPKRFQYKIVHGKTGSTGSLSGAKKWDNNLAGIVLVWRAPDSIAIAKGSC